MRLWVVEGKLVSEEKDQWRPVTTFYRKKGKKDISGLHAKGKAARKAARKMERLHDGNKGEIITVEYRAVKYSAIIRRI